MSNRSLSWYAAIGWVSDLPWDAGTPVSDSVVPWITHAVNAKLRELICRIGVVRKLKAGENVIPEGAPVDRLVLVTKGVTGREVGRVSQAIALSPPWHFACGNLNFFTEQPCIGKYFALVDSEVVAVPQELLRKILRSDQELAWIFAVQSELCTLSDRLGFGALAALSVEDRLKALFISWGRKYGRYEVDRQGRAWCRMPQTVQRKFLAAVIHTSRVSLDKTLHKWKAEGSYAVAGDEVSVRYELLEPVYSWIVRMEENARISRPKNFRESLLLHQRRD